jgi:hypothetical protein
MVVAVRARWGSPLGTRRLPEVQMRKPGFTGLVGACSILLVAATAARCGGSVPPDPGEAADGGATEAGSCIDNGMSHAVGPGWRCSDGCNSCWCVDSGLISSTLIACSVPGDLDAGQASSCNDHASGSTWSDGCNVCLCENGLTRCSTHYCGVVDASFYDAILVDALMSGQ